MRDELTVCEVSDQGCLVTCLTPGLTGGNQRYYHSCKGPGIIDYDGASQSIGPSDRQTLVPAYTTSWRWLEE